MKEYVICNGWSLKYESRLKSVDFVLAVHIYFGIVL